MCCSAVEARRSQDDLERKPDSGRRMKRPVLRKRNCEDCLRPNTEGMRASSAAKADEKPGAGFATRSLAVSLFPSQYYSLHHLFIQSNTSRCQNTEFWGFSIQWFSSGKSSIFEGTPIIWAALNAAIP